MDVEIRAVDYVHEWRTSGLSDHSGLRAELDLPA